MKSTLQVENKRTAPLARVCAALAKAATTTATTVAIIAAAGNVNLQRAVSHLHAIEYQRLLQVVNRLKLSVAKPLLARGIIAPWKPHLRDFDVVCLEKGYQVTLLRLKRQIADIGRVWRARGQPRQVYFGRANAGARGRRHVGQILATEEQNKHETNNGREMNCNCKHPQS